MTVTVDNDDDNDNDVNGRFVASICSVAIGIGYLYPFSALTQPVDYYEILLPNYNIEFIITFVYMWINLIVLGSLVFISGEYSYTVRIVGGFVGQLVILLLIPASYYLHLDERGNFYVLILLTASAAIVTALIDSCAISLVAQYPQNVQESLQLGIGVSTLIGSVFKIATKLYFPRDQVIKASLAYFYVGALTIFFCIIAYFYLSSLPISRRCLSRQSNDTNADAIKDLVPLSPLSPNLAHYRRLRIQDDDIELTSKTHPVIVESSSLLINQSSSSSQKRWAIFWKVLLNEVLVFVVFFQTLSLWPSLITEIKSYNFSKMNDSKWWSLILLFLFALSDVVGRYLVSYIRGPLNKSNIWIIVILRFVSFPLLICSAKGIIFQNDMFTILFVLLLGGSNGFIGTLCIIFVNDCVLPIEKAIAGNFTAFFLNGGLVFGALCSFYVEYVVNE